MYWSKWFKEMQVKKFDLFETDLPVNTAARIQSFLNSK